MPVGMRLLRRIWSVTRQVVVGYWDDDGFILSGHMAYLALLALFPFFLLLASLAAQLGRTSSGLEAIAGFLAALPPNVAAVLKQPMEQVLAQNPGGLVTLSILVAVWTAGSFIEAIRIVIHKAYNHTPGRAFWQYRLQSFTMVIGSCIILMAAMSAQFALGAALKVIGDHLPLATEAQDLVGWGRNALTPLLLFISLYSLYFALTPRWRKGLLFWPGALLSVLIWLLAAALLPRAIGSLGTYDLTYGSLAGVMITLLFFYLVGSGFVLGAQLNAALVRPDPDEPAA
jgi:membrane protein